MRIAITTLGCKINQYDSAVIQSRLEKYSFVPFDEPADCYIINSCTVTDRADREARQLARRAKRLNPDAKVLITGCYAQVDPEEVARVAEVDFIVGLNRLDDLVRFVEMPAVDRVPVVSVSNVKRERGVQVLGTRALPGHTRAFLKVQEGCNYSCTYCIIPMARGLSRSVPPWEVLNQVRVLADAGFKEIVLTGIHLGGYGQDLRPKVDLTALLETLARSRSVPRIRLSSLDPRELSDPLLDLLVDSDVVCPHLHICAQAGEDKTLRSMRRNYGTAYYRDLVLRVREKLPEAALGSDIIVGFPGETEADFDHGLNFFSSLPLTYFHVFPYSVRRGTVAADLPDQIPEAVKKKRARQMRELGANKQQAFYRRFHGRMMPVLLEDRSDRSTGYHKGFTRNYLPVIVAAHGKRINCEVDVRLQFEAGSLMGHPAEDHSFQPEAAISMVSDQSIRPISRAM